jgi:hypothetical protein
MFIAVFKSEPETDTHLTIGEAGDGGFQKVGRQFDVSLTPAQKTALKKALRTKNGIDEPKCTAIYNLMLEKKSNAQIQRMGYYKSRVLATIRATLLPTRKKQK